MPDNYDTLYKGCMKLDENWERSSVLKIVKLEILQGASNDPKPASNNRPSKVPYKYRPQDPESQIFKISWLFFVLFFLDVPHLKTFPLTPMLKFKVPQNF